MLPPVWNETHVLWPKMPNEKMPDVFISWQNTEAAHLYNSTVYAARNITPPASYLWLHVLPPPPSFFKHFYNSTVYADRSITPPPATSGSTYCP
jgi:hypothetical protein